jgi:prevent-host-death family protein
MEAALTVLPAYDHGNVTIVMTPREITASQFKARCLRLLDEVAESGEALVVTKHGRPVARVEPPLRPDDLQGSVEFNISDEDLVYFSMGPWDMEQE